MEPYRFLNVRIRPSIGAAGDYCWNWQVLEDDGRLIGSASESYDIETAALRGGNAAGRAIRKRGWPLSAT
jgi:hypothetical protein